MAEETTGFPGTPEEIDNILSDVTEPEEIRVLKTEEERAVAVKIIPFLVAKVNKQLEVKRAKELEKTIEQIKQENNKLIEAEVNRIREVAKPPDLKQIEQLLNQEYVEVQFKDPTGKEFVIRELPQAAEQKFLQIIQKKLMPKIAQFTSLDWTNNNTVLERYQKIVDSFPDALNIMAEIVTIALNPFNQDKEITTEWVAEHISSYRMYMIIQAQIEAGKMRDFILGLFRSFPGRTTT